MDAWDDLNLPKYTEDFEHVLFQIGFTDFLKHLEQLNNDLVLPLHVAAMKWKKVIEEKHAEWKDDDICAAEKRDRLVQALLSANEENYEAYRRGKMGDDKWTVLEAERETKARRLASLVENGEIKLSKKQRKRANRRANLEFKKMEGTTLGTILTKHMGVQKKSKKPRSGCREVQRDPIASRLRSKGEAPDLPPLEQDFLVGGVPVPYHGEDMAMEL